MKITSHIVLNGKLIRADKAAVNPFNRGMMYGDGCFETLKSYPGGFLKWDQHFQRLQEGLDYLDINRPFDSKALKDQVLELLNLHDLKNKEAMVRIQCWRDGGRGYAPTTRNAGWMMQASEIVSDATPQKLTVANTRCIPEASLSRRFKLSNGLNYIKAAQEAKSKNADDAIMLTLGGNVSETTISNIFWVKDRSIFTPSVECDLLRGVTRSIVLDICKRIGVSVVEGAFTLDKLHDAEAVFTTNSISEIRETQSIDDTGFHIGHKLVDQLKEEFDKYKKENLKP